MSRDMSTWAPELCIMIIITFTQIMKELGREEKEEREKEERKERESERGGGTERRGGRT